MRMNLWTPEDARCGNVDWAFVYANHSVYKHQPRLEHNYRVNNTHLAALSSIIFLNAGVMTFSLTSSVPLPNAFSIWILSSFVIGGGLNMVEYRRAF